FAGTVKEIKIKVGDKAAEGTLILTLETSDADSPAAAEPEARPVPEKAEEAPKAAIPEPSRPAPEPPKVIQPAATPNPIGASAIVTSGKSSHASPSVRKFARELGVNLALVQGTGPKNRILQSDVQAFVKGELAKPRTENMGAGMGAALSTL